MTHFGLLCPTASSHLNAMIALGYELKQRGHRVTLISLPDAEAKVSAAGLEFQAIGERDFPKGYTATVFAKLGKLNGIKAFRYSVEIFKAQTLTLLEEAPDILQQLGVEAMLVDQTSLAGSTVAQYLDLPFISVCCALMLNRDPKIPPLLTSWRYDPSIFGQLRNRLGYALLTQAAKPITQVVAEYRQKWNLPPVTKTKNYSKLAQIAQQPSDFEFPRKMLPQSFHFTGPYTNPLLREPAPFPFDALTGQPLIYASLGTIQNRLAPVFYAIAEACLGLDVQLVIALGGGMAPEDLPDLPGSPLVMGYVPQLEILKRTSLTITHAGLNTTLESLSNGVPMVAIPIANDQPGVAARIAWTGTGEVVPLQGINSSKLRTAIQQVLGEPSYRTNAERLQESIRKAGGVQKAVDIIEQAIRSGQPVLANP